jgi:O-antigen/teichoic acid export membrane protein
MEKSRTQNTIYNTIYGAISSISMVLLNFLVRYFLVKELGEEIYGIHSFFQNLTNVLLLLELGISSAVIIHLYEPIKNKDYCVVKEILSYYRKVYIYLAVVFFTICVVYGLVLLPYNITTSIDNPHLILFFLIFSLSFTGNYLTYHKRSVLFADQKNRVSIFYTMICEYIFRGFQILTLIFIHSYIIFLFLLVCEKVVANFLCINYVNKNYPELSNYKSLTISDGLKENIIKTMKPLFVNQIAGTLQNAAPSFIIGFLLGNVSIVGYYANYQLLISSILLLFSQIGGAFTTSFGNLSVERNIERMENAYKKTSFIANCIAIVVCSVFLSCVQDFISFVFGERFLLSWLSLILLVCTMIVTLFNIPVISIQNAMGIHKLDSKFMVIQAILSVLIGYALCLFFKMEGLFVGFLIPTVYFTLYKKGCIVTNYVFGWNEIKYIKFIVVDIVKLIFIVAPCAFISSYVHFDNLLFGMIVKGLISLFMSVILFSIISIKNDYYNQLFKFTSVH